MRSLNENLDDRVQERTADLERARVEVDALNTELEARVAERTRQLESASEQFRLLFEHAPLGVSWVEFGETDVYHLNDRFCEIIGLPKEKAQNFQEYPRGLPPGRSGAPGRIPGEDQPGGDRSLLAREALYSRRRCRGLGQSYGGGSAGSGRARGAAVCHHQQYHQAQAGGGKAGGQ